MKKLLTATIIAALMGAMAVPAFAANKDTMHHKKKVHHKKVVHHTSAPVMEKPVAMSADACPEEARPVSAHGTMRVVGHHMTHHMTHHVTHHSTKHHSMKHHSSKKAAAAPKADDAAGK